MNEDLLYKLAFRLAGRPFGTEVGDFQFLPGRLPESLPIPVPMPEGSAVLASTIYGPTALGIFLDVPLSVQEVGDFYQRELSTSGWQTQEEVSGMSRGGFAHMHLGRGNFLNYVHSSDWDLHINIGRESQGVTDVRLQLNQDKRSATLRRRQRRQMHGAMFDVFPELLPPDGALQQGGSHSSSGDSASTNAKLELLEEWNIGDLSEHYARQLVKAGWTQLEQESAPHSYWSVWTFTDKEQATWRGAFYLFRLAGEKIHYQLTLQADAEDAVLF
jgi:hypothetical protein